MLREMVASLRGERTTAGMPSFPRFAIAMRSCPSCKLPKGGLRFAPILSKKTGSALDALQRHAGALELLVHLFSQRRIDVGIRAAAGEYNVVNAVLR